MMQYLKKQLDHVEWYVIALFFILLPAIYSTKLLDPVLYSRYYALSAFLILLTFGMGSMLIFKRFKFRLAKVDRWVFAMVGLYVVWNFLAVIGAVNIKEAIFQSLKEATLMITFFYFYQLLRNNLKGREIIIKAVVIMAAIFLGIALYQIREADFSTVFEAAEHKGYYLNQAIDGMFSTFSGKNLFAMGMVLLLPFSIYSVVFYNKFWKVLSISNLLVSFFFIFIMSSKSAWVFMALFFGLLYMLYVIYRLKVLPRENNSLVELKTKLVLFVLPALIVLAGVFLVAKSDVTVFSFIKDKVLQVVSPEYCEQSIYSSDHPTSAQTRNLVWAQSFQMAKDNPILGVGPGNWRIHQPSYGLNAYEEKIRQGEMLFQRPHNDYLWIATETGFLGLIAYLVLYFIILVLAYKNFIHNKESKIRLFNALAFASLIGFAVVMLFSFPRERIVMNAVYLMMFAIVLSDSPFKSKDEECNTSSFLSLGVLGVLLGILVFNLIVTRDIYKGEMAARYVKIGVVKENWKLILRASMSTEGTYYTLDPFNVPMQYWKGAALAKLDQRVASKVAFQEAIRLCPYNIRPLNNLAASLDLIGKKDSAKMYFEKALEISPRYNDALVNMAIVTVDLESLKKNSNSLQMSDLARFDKALEYLKKVEGTNNIPVKYDEVTVVVCKIQAQILQSKIDRSNLIAWLQNDDNIKKTFLKFKNGNELFRQILIAELGIN